MTTTNTESGIRALTLGQLQVSTTESQTERRKHFDKAAMAELSESIKTVGLLSPIIARPVNGHFEVVAGERRLIAAKAAGLTAISVDVRTLTDEQVLEIQLVENLQREGLHELAEAEGYAKLQSYGHSAEEIAHKVGKSRAYVYGRMKLLTLGPAAREAFYRGELTASTAALLARIPVASVQREACGKITHDYRDGVMSFRDARDFIEREYMLQLKEAPFPTGNAELLPKAGACGNCPKRTGNQVELFADVKSPDVCTDPACFKLKREAWSKLQIVQARETGRKVIAGAQAKEIAPYGDQSFAQGYTRLDAKCWDDPKHRTYKQILGKAAEPVLVQLPKGGDLIELVQKNDAIKKLKADGVIKPIDRSLAPKPGAKSKAADHEHDEAVEKRLFESVRAADGGKIKPEHLRYVLAHLLASGDFNYDWITKEMGFEPAAYYLDNIKKLEKLSDAKLARTLIDTVYMADLEFEYSGNDFMRRTAKHLKIDEKKIRKDVVSAAAAGKTPAPAKPVKKAKAKKK